MTGAATPRVEPGALRDAVREFVASQSGHGLDVVALDVVDDGRKVVGKVLTARQARAVAELAHEHGSAAEVTVAADPDSGLEDGWVAPATEVLDLWRTPARAGQEMGRQTQYIGGDPPVDGPLRRFGSAGDFVLVQGIDLAMGWARGQDLREVDATDARGTWAGVARAVEGASRPPANAGSSAADVVERARLALGSPYVWGATGGGGYDCSGLVQRAYDVTGVLLPRHSADQRRVGLRVVAGEVQPGDLLFARPLTQKVGHVMLMTSPTTVLHACRTEHRVIEEGLDENAKRYQHQGWRRPVEWEL